MIVTGDLFNLEGKVVVITGGAGQLGRTWAEAIGGQGGRVVVLDRIKPESADDRFTWVKADVTDRPSLEAALEETIGRCGVPDGLINAAALDSPPDAPIEENGPFEQYPEASWDRVMEVNVKGVYLCCQVFGGAMAREGRGSIINIGSIYGLVSPNQDVYQYRRDKGETFYKPVAYSSSKSALLNLTRYLATYWAKAGVRVNTLTLAGVFNNQDREFLDNYSTRIPIGRMARQEEYNGPVIFLLSPASVYMTGSNLVVDGGWTAW